MYHEADAGEERPINRELAKHALKSEAKGRIESMIALARSEPGIAITPEELDADPWALNLSNGTVDLRTGELREHRREDLITKIAPVAYDPDAPAPVWEAFLERVLPSEDLRAFVQQAAGYSATGDTSEQCLFINHGTGANGKSTYQEAIAAALGDYAMRAPTEMLLAKRSGGIPNDVARLKGARFVAASETEEGRRLAESLVKDLTGQDTISARFMRAEWFDFRPTHKLWLSTNHKPEIRGTDTAIWRRIRLIPWSVTILPAEQDKKLPAVLRRELPGILAWIVRGCLEWRRGGLQAPEEVRKATGEYRAEMDVLAVFLGECCESGPELWDYAKDLYTSYKRWCGETGERAETQRKFGERLRERGFQRDRGGSRGAGIWRGLRLSEEERARIEGMLTLQKSGISSSSDPSDPKKQLTGEKVSRGS
jgi:putative DNA primase/helicase